MRMLFLFTVAVFAMCSASAQQVTLKKADIPHIPTDTLPTDRGEVRIVTFSDGTFRYIPTNPYHFMSAPAYESHWDTLNLFAYRTIQLADLPARIDIEMSESCGFHAPATGKILSRYGRRSGRDHDGIDISVNHGQPIYAAFDGVVRFSRWNSGGYGNLIIVRHPSGLETWYGHLSRRAIVANEWVRAGQVIGYGGRTGRASADHLHFEVRYADQSFDPERLIDFEREGLLRRTYVLRKDYFNIRSRASEILDEDSPLLATTDSLGGTPLLDSLLLADARLASEGSKQASGLAQTASPEPVFHKIVSGDTLLALARRYGTTVTKICSLNGITRTTTLRLGRNLRIH